MNLRILVTACPLLGHVNSVLPFAFAAARAGHDVVFATGPDLVDHVRRRGLNTLAVGPSHAAAGGRAALSIDYFLETAAGRADDLVPWAAGWRPDLVVHDEIELAGAITAAVSGARNIAHGIGLTRGPEVATAFAAAAAPLMRHWGVDIAHVRGDGYLTLCPPALDPDATDPSWAQPVRPQPGLPDPGDSLPERFADLPHPRTVHLTLGTVFHDAPAVFAAALRGLSDMDVNVVGSVGPAADPAAFGPQPDHVLLAPYIPHALLLPHCDLVVSQGGAGVVLGTLAAGLPHLALPQGADQFGNAARLQGTGAGRTLASAGLTAAAVTAAAQALLTDPAHRAAANRVRGEIAAMPDADVAVAALTGVRW